MHDHVLITRLTHVAINDFLAVLFQICPECDPTRLGVSHNEFEETHKGTRDLIDVNDADIGIVEGETHAVEMTITSFFFFLSLSPLRNGKHCCTDIPCHCSAPCY